MFVFWGQSKKTRMCSSWQVHSMHKFTYGGGWCGAQISLEIRDEKVTSYRDCSLLVIWEAIFRFNGKTCVFRNCFWCSHISFVNIVLIELFFTLIFWYELYSQGRLKITFVRETFHHGLRWKECLNQTRRSQGRSGEMSEWANKRD